MAFATIQDVKYELGIEDATLSDNEINYFLKQAHLELLSLSGRDYVVDNFTLALDKNNNLDLNLRLFFSDVYAVNYVYDNEDQVLAEGTDYTVDLTRGIITLNSSGDWSEGDRIKAEYVPNIFAIYEAKKTALLLIERSALMSSGEVSSVKADLLKAEVEELRRWIQRPYFSSFTGARKGGFFGTNYRMSDIYDQNQY